MARPKPTILIEIVDNNKLNQVLASEGIWAVYYQSRPINLKIISNTNIPKYKNTVYVNKGHAINQAKKLNRQFKTSDFSVVLLTESEPVD